MAREANLYYDYWRRQISYFLEDLKDDTLESVEYEMPKEKFEEMGNRQTSGYSFRLKIHDGEVAKNIGGSAVARDSYEALNDNPEFRTFAKGRYMYSAWIQILI